MLIHKHGQRRLRLVPCSCPPRHDQLPVKRRAVQSSDRGVDGVGALDAQHRGGAARQDRRTGKGGHFRERGLQRGGGGEAGWQVAEHDVVAAALEQGAHKVHAAQVETAVRLCWP